MDAKELDALEDAADKAARSNSSKRMVSVDPGAVLYLVARARTRPIPKDLSEILAWVESRWMKHHSLARQIGDLVEAYTAMEEQRDAALKRVRELEVEVKRMATVVSFAMTPKHEPPSML